MRQNELSRRELPDHTAGHVASKPGSIIGSMNDSTGRPRVETLRRARAWLMAERGLGRLIKVEEREGRTVYACPSGSGQSDGSCAFQDDDGAWVCTCRDFDARREPCKHVCLVWDTYVPNLAPPPPTEAALKLLRRGRSSGQWYADARSFAHVPHPYAEGPAESTRRDHAIAEQDVRGEELLLDLARVLNARYPLEASPNRPTLPAGDKVAVSVMRSLHRKGMRRSRKVLERLAQSGGIAFAPCKNSQVAYNVDPRTTRYVRDGIGIAASPYTLMEQDVIMDASGFSSFFNSCWRDSEHGQQNIQPGTIWFKVHIAIGRISKAILAVVVTTHVGPGTGDASNLRLLIEELVRRGFNLRYVIADNAYLTQENFEFCKSDAVGARLVGPLKPKNYYRTGKPREAVRELHAFKRATPGLYDELCRARQPIEGVFSVEKRYDNHVAAIGTALERAAAADGTGSRLFVSRQNELLSRILRHTLVRTVTEEHLRNRRISYLKGSVFSHVRETVEGDAL